jgi:hypothetical protein
MGKISEYVSDSTLTGADKLIGTDSGNNNATANYTIDAVTQYVKTQTGVSATNVLAAASYIDQPAGALNTTKKVSFGAAQNSASDAVMLAADGTVTFNQAGTYIINGYGTTARTGSNGVTILLFRSLLNNVQIGTTKGFEIDKTDIWTPYEITVPLVVNANDTFHFEIMNQVHADAVLVAHTVGVTGWVNVPSAALSIWKLQVA